MNLFNLFFCLTFIFFFNFQLIHNYGVNKSLEFKFTKKLVSIPFKTKYQSNSLIFELLDVNYALSVNMQVESKFNKIDQSKIDERDIKVFKSNMIPFGFTFIKEIGKGNYGFVFLANSSIYGVVVIKFATNTDGVFYNVKTKRECSLIIDKNKINITQTLCEKSSFGDIVPFEIASAIRASTNKGVVKMKAFGLISSDLKLMFYFIVMENVKHSMNLRSFSQKCLKNINLQKKFIFIEKVLNKLSEINVNLIQNAKMFHNDLKSDNVLIKFKKKENFSSKNCLIESWEHFQLYLIDFGNAILDLDNDFNTTLTNQNDALLNLDKYKGKKYFLKYRAPEIACKLKTINLYKLLPWYLGVIAFEMCSDGFQMPPNSSIAPKYKIDFISNSRYSCENHLTGNGFDSFIKPTMSAKQKLTKMPSTCFHPLLIDYFRDALEFNPFIRKPLNNFNYKSLFERTQRVF